MILKPKNPKTATPQERLRQLEAEARGLNYEGWCRQMGIDYSKTPWCQRILEARLQVREQEAKFMAWAKVELEKSRRNRKATTA